MDQITVKTRCLSSLSKVFADQEPQEKPYHRATALRNETFSFQVAYWSDQLLKPLFVKVKSELHPYITVRTVGLAPSELPCFHDVDDNVLRINPGLYPDPLYPLDESDEIAALPQQWRSIWITVELNEKIHKGVHSLEIVFETEAGEVKAKERMELEVIDAWLPKQTLLHTEWFHTDCLATQYHVEVFSDRYWELVDQYLQTAVKHGINMILTPLFTPPLDTEIGGERPTVQLIDVEKREDGYMFGFERLEKWVDLCVSRGIEYFEFSHLFTQWGAKHAPKIIAVENGEKRKIFGWETEAAGTEYRDFLSSFLPELISFIKEKGMDQRCYFHVSDEPRMDDLKQYQMVSEFVRAYLGEFPIIDALSNFAFYEHGAVQTPIPSSNHIEPFIDHGVSPLWTYYCVSQREKVSNRFFNFPSARNRIIGLQMYKFQVVGFLHWGFNFWYSQFSKSVIDPFKVTDAHYAFPSGDAFLVYPGENGPIESIRMEVFYEALQDQRALQLLETMIGREQVLDLLEYELAKPITFSEYPKSSDWLLNMREKINQQIKENVQLK